MPITCHSLAAYGLHKLCHPFRQYIQNLPSDQFLILVTSFEEDNTTDRLSLRIFENLEDLARDYNDVEVKRLSRQFPTVNEEARAIGKKEKASIVIWGSYEEAGEQLTSTNANFTLITPPPDAQAEIDYSDKARGETPFSVEEPEQLSLSFPNQISSETNYLTLFTLGLIDYFEDELTQSIASFDRALKVAEELEDRPKLYPSYYYKGNAYLYLENYEQAIDSYDEVVEISPAVKGVLLNRGVALARIEGQEKEALEDINAFVESYPEDIRGYMNQGLIYFLLEDYTSSIASFNEVLEREPKNIVALTNKGKSLMAKGAKEEAIALFNDALDIDPENTTTLSSKALALEEKGMYAEALFLYEKVIDKKSDSPYAYYRKAKILYERENDVDAAIRAYDAALRLDPELFLVAFSKAGMLYQEQMYEEAVSASDIALALQPDQPSSYYVLHTTKGNAFNKLGRYDDALSAFDEASKIDSTDIGVSLGKGIALQRLEMYESAAESYKSAVTLASDELKPNLYKQIALCYSLAGESEQALDFIESYVETTQSVDKDFFDNPGFDSLREDARFTSLL